MAHDTENLVVPTRRIPVPAMISEEGRKTIREGSPLARLLFDDPDPAADDKDGWRQFIANRNALGTPMVKKLEEIYPCGLVTHDLNAAPLYEVTPPTCPAGGEKRAALYMHGGGFTTAGGIAGGYMAMPFATQLGLVTYSLDYRMPPDHPFPAALDDAVEAYRYLLKDRAPHDIVFAGRSAGGNIAAALALRVRDLGLPLPAACLLETPAVNLTGSGDSVFLNDGVDNFCRPMPNAFSLYADGADLRDPYLSPVFGDFSKGFPPTICTTGTRDLLLSDAVTLHRALRRVGVEAELHVWEGMGHGGFLGTAPEDQEVWNELKRFADRHLAD